MKFLYHFKPFNRREDLRVEPNVVINCVLEYIDNEGRKLITQAQITDVSGSGALLEMGEIKFYPKNRVSIIIQMPSQQEQFTIHARVVRTYRRKGQNTYHSGMKFVDRLEPGIQVLLDYARRYSL